MNMISNIGKYFNMLFIVFSKPEKAKVFRKRVFDEIELIGIKSIPIVALLSTFMGGVIALQTASNMDSPLLPEYTIGYITRSSTILEFSPTIISLILAGKVGSNIASEIGTMRVTEQIDALEIMGVNSLAFLVLPKILGAVLFFPLLLVFSIGLSLIGGWLSVVMSGLSSTETYVYGLRSFFEFGNIIYALVKSVTFGFIIVSVSSFYGYYTSGGALDVGRSSTQAVVSSSIVILICNFFLTQMILL
ncbi:MAG: ABC transporter permease [Crocinitomicaceae bacterium]|jgi:phospholipid/cholesterol/gamma-HCH transport system permease protein|nr:ABC transporter permease [Crocinitomicaceae bacterium]